MAQQENVGGHQWEFMNIATYAVMNLMAIISGCFLGDALRRIQKTFKDLRGLLPNEKVMLLHLSVFVLYMVTTFYKTYQIASYFNHENDSNLTSSQIAYTICIWASFLDQLILCYLFIKFSAPATQVIDVESSGEKTCLRNTESSWGSHSQLEYKSLREVDVHDVETIDQTGSANKMKESEGPSECPNTTNQEF